MLWSKMFIPTLREEPLGVATAAKRLLTRAGFLRGLSCLPLGTRSLRRIATIMREELRAMGGQEFSSPRTPFTGAARELRSYKQLPQVWYRFDENLEAWSYGLIAVGFLETARAILRRCGVACLEADSLSGIILVVTGEAGDDLVARAGSYAAELRSAVSTPKPVVVPDPEGDLAPVPFHTPNCKTIAELAQFTGLPETSLLKTFVVAASESLYVVLLRGDHQVSEAKLARILGVDELKPASAEQIRGQFGAGAGSLGPVGVQGIRILADEALRGRHNMIAGANRDDYHLRHVTPGEDFAAEFFDLRQVELGDTHNGEPLRIERGVRVGSVSREMVDQDLHVTDESGKQVDVRVGSCAMFLEQILWAAAEQHHDADGLILPPAIAPFDLIVTPVDYATEAQRAAASEIAAAAEAAGLETLIDDRLERPGVKFKDADLIGVPWRITIGKKLEQGSVEVVERRSKEKTDVPLTEAIGFIRTRR